MAISNNTDKSQKHRIEQKQGKNQKKPKWYLSIRIKNSETIKTEIQCTDAHLNDTSIKKRSNYQKFRTVVIFRWWEDVLIGNDREEVSQ